MTRPWNTNEESAAINLERRWHPIYRLAFSPPPFQWQSKHTRRKRERRYPYGNHHCKTGMLIWIDENVGAGPPDWANLSVRAMWSARLLVMRTADTQSALTLERGGSKTRSLLCPSQIKLVRRLFSGKTRSFERSIKTTVQTWKWNKKEEEKTCSAFSAPIHQLLSNQGR